MTPAERFRRRTFPLFAALLLGGSLVGGVAGPLAQRLGSPELLVALAVQQSRGAIGRGPSFSWSRSTGSSVWSLGQLKAEDPWGTPIACRPTVTAPRGSTSGTSPPSYFSFGPNGANEDGQGDDITPEVSHWLLASWLDGAGWIVFGSTASLGLWVMLLYHGTESRTLGGELSLATLIALPVALGTWQAATHLLRPWGDELYQAQWSPLPISPGVMTFGSAAFFCYLATVGLRLRLKRLGILPKPQDLAPPGQDSPD